MVDLEIFCIADDLTGALESGSKFALEGLSSLVSTRPPSQLQISGPGVQALVVDAETRHLSPDAACRRVMTICSAAPAASVIYKKTDSTLRGNIGAEFRGLSSAFRGMPIVYVPAYPQMGRTVRGGRLFVNGVPLHLTHFAADPLNPTPESHIPTLLAAEIGVCSVGSADELSKASQEAVYMVDAETDGDVRRAAEAFAAGGWRIAAGPAAFAAQVARGTRGPRTVQRIPSGIRTCLIVNGSLHPRSALQAEAARRAGLPSCNPDGIARAFETAPWVSLDTARLDTSGLQRARQVGEIVREALRHVDLDAVAVLGGDTAFGILRALGEPALHPRGEVVPGVPVSVAAGADLCRILNGRTKDLVLVTKAGGFGPLNVLGSIRDRLARDSSET